MKLVTLLGVILAFVLGTVGCNRSHRTHARDDSTGGERARSHEMRDQAEREHDAGRKGKVETWEYEEESIELRDDAKQKAHEAGDWSEEKADEEGDYAEDKAEDVKDFSKEKTDQAEDRFDDSRDALDNESEREYDVIE